jgi:8-oxo-dGTP diphosphatase
MTLRSGLDDPPIRVVACVVARGDELLVCQRPHAKRHGGLWEFPGGKCEAGESDESAARREMAEELGVTVTRVGSAEHEFHDPGSPYVIVFLRTEITGEPVCHEHIALTWGLPEILSSLPLAPTDRRYIEVIRNAARS